MDCSTSRQSNQLPTNLPQLQNLIKRDPQSYYEEFQLQYHHYKALLQLFLLNPSQDSKTLQDLVMFLAQVSQSYAEEMKSFPDDLQTLLKQQATVLHPDVRMVLCRALILMRNRNYIPPDSLLELFFSLFRCQDKLLRSTLYSHIVSDIKRINSKHKNNKVNKMLQNFMYQMLKDSSPVAAKMSLDVMIELYHRNIWNDAKTVNVITTACSSPVTKIVVTAVKFFLTEGQKSEDDEDSSDSGSEGTALRQMMVSKQVNKKGKKREKKIAKALQVLKKQKKKHKLHPQANFSALYLINDPQEFAERLLKKLETCREKFDVRLLLMNLISRLIGVHKLFVFNFYPYLQRYIQPHQREVTRLLSFLAQASHELVPPEIIEPALRTVVDNFVTERNSSEAIAIGLNAVRELCTRCPLAMSGDLLQDLTSYKKYKDKSVMMASRSLIQLFRTVNPSLLARKDKGRPTESGAPSVKQYGDSNALEHVPGAEHLPGDCDFITQEQFETIRLNQAAEQVEPLRGKKRAVQDMIDLDESSELVSVSQIESLAKRQKMDKEARIESIKAGRESREKFGYKKHRMNPHGSTTNKEKRKNKDFRMLKQNRNVRNKTKRSFREKQVALKNSLLKKMRRK